MEQIGRLGLQDELSQGEFSATWELVLQDQALGSEDLRVTQGPSG